MYNVTGNIGAAGSCIDGNSAGMLPGRPGADEDGSAGRDFYFIRDNVFAVRLTRSGINNFRIRAGGDTVQTDPLRGDIAGLQLDLVEACAWGTVSGGFACFYPGGAYEERERGEKRKNISRYYSLYRKQIFDRFTLPPAEQGK